MARKQGFGPSRELLYILVPLLVIAGAGWTAMRFADPGPPTTLVISAASKGSPYHRLAERYKATFARNGVNLEIRESQGSAANIAALKTKETGVHAAFVQGGLVAPSDANGLHSLGRVAYEPLWVFYTGESKLERLSDLAGKRVLVGPAGGGTNGLALRLLEANGVTAANTMLLNRELPDYVDILAKGEADAGFLVLAAEARTVQRLLATPAVKLMSFTNADAYAQKFPFLSKLDLREGVVDLGRRIPPVDTTLIATTAAVLVRDDTHRALVNLLAQAVHEVHSSPASDVSGQAALFQRPGEFPTPVDPEFAMSDEAKRVYRSGAPLLQRYVPFWLATMLDRLLVSMVVVLPLLVPLTKIGPQVYRWTVRRRLLHWYGALKELEASTKTAGSPEDRDRQIAELDRIDTAVDTIPIPLGFADQHYELRQHIDTVRNRLTQRQTRSIVGVDNAPPFT